MSASRRAPHSCMTLFRAREKATRQTSRKQFATYMYFVGQHAKERREPTLEINLGYFFRSNNPRYVDLDISKIIHTILHALHELEVCGYESRCESCD